MYDLSAKNKLQDGGTHFATLQNTAWFTEIASVSTFARRQGPPPGNEGGYAQRPGARISPAFKFPWR